MLKIISSFLKLAHTVIITSICIKLCNQTPSICLNTIFIEFGFTILSILITKKHFLDLLQVAISLFLTYTLIPNNYSFLSGLFFLKIIYVFNSLGEVIEDLFSSTGNTITRILKIIVSIFRYTLVEYLFLGLVLLCYKLWTLNDPEGTLPDDNLLFYKLIVTASTVGYGDVTPKTNVQISYFIYAIPFICASFTIYFNAVIPILGQLIDTISGNRQISVESEISSAQSNNLKAWNLDEKESFTNFIEEVGKRQAQTEEIHNKLGHNWIALSASYYQRQIPLINQVLRGDETKEVKLKVCSKIRRQYYPSGWTILQAGDVSQDLIMIDEGELKSPKTQGRPFIFNKGGFFSKSPSRETYTTASFVTVWAISMRDLQQLALSSAKIRQSLSEIRRDHIQ